MICVLLRAAAAPPSHLHHHQQQLARGPTTTPVEARSSTPWQPTPSRAPARAAASTLQLRGLQSRCAPTGNAAPPRAAAAVPDRHQQHQGDDAPTSSSSSMAAAWRDVREPRRQPQQPQQPQPPARKRSGPGAAARSVSLAEALGVSVPAAASMLAAFPALRNYDHAALADKLRDAAALLGVQPPVLAKALASEPRVLSYSLAALERRLSGLSWLQPDRQQLTQLVLRQPSLLRWQPHTLRSRAESMAAELGTDVSTVAALVQRHPLLLPASSHMRRSLQLLQQLLLLAAASEQAGFGTGIAAGVQDAAARHEQQALLQFRSVASQAAQSEVAPQQQAAVALTPGAIGAAARQLALSHPQLLLSPPEALQLRVAALQARSGLSAAHVAALLVSQPELLLEEAPPPPAASRHRRRGDRQRGLPPG